ncbi:PSP1 domain-containing protein [Dysgonomonas macrotermitis]|uniref:Cell fate regulator YaaT, PSP1 superfamily (Controls sporulation, competence, biofilm development) n=1 Tax=Dysgonomonas macrotermitis TaxID=1346286 RepID=A0A1M4ZWG5_9BACT|nr:regulatory iron-sulfur-containing complex subunit RicT [Dysgonomonas macrotermitis]SHF22187.1 Cell fate regulator YaaT, PSP1 superfamily (controls sporulation, competence, biofilm development) [Dysgonomonas macrotermitis]
MEFSLNQDRGSKRINDCKGTCKTPIGCTCKGDKVAEQGETSIGTAIKMASTIENNLCTCGKNPGGACGCKTGEGCGCGSSKSGESKGCGGCSKKSKCCCTKGTHKLEVFDWLSDLPEAEASSQMVEVQFKNTRKGYYLNSNNLELYKGDVVAVEATPGHDIGEVTLTGKLVPLQMRKNNYRSQTGEHKRIYRIAKPADIDKYNEAKALEHKTMLRAREIAEELGLQMKISDVEYQGDGNKAIFYYIADERVDFRQLIKVYAEKFRVKIEMKQIGARQEAGRVGGIGPCGRELCCSSSMSNFVSVSTSAARFQDISLNPQKLAGQCGKLKCCLNYEVDTYVEAQRKLPSRETVLDTKDGSYFHFKTDILSGTMTYSTDKNFAANLVSLPKDRVYEVIRMNKNGNKPVKLTLDEDEVNEKLQPKDILEQENINRFDNKGSRNNGKKKVVRGDKRQPENENRAQNQAPRNKDQNSNNNQRANNKEAVATNNNEPRNNAESQQRNRNRNNRNRNRNRNGDNRAQGKENNSPNEG